MSDYSLDKCLLRPYIHTHEIRKEGLRFSGLPEEVRPAGHSAAFLLLEMQ